MFEDNFRKALFDALTPEYEQILNEASEEHEFSHKFEKKMQKLVKRRNKPYYKLINTVGKRVACIAVIIIVASTVTAMSVEALRNVVADFFVSIYEKFSTIQSADEDISVPLTIEDIYGITYDLDGYEIIYEEKEDRHYNITYNKDDIIIDFQQFVKDAYNRHINTEDAEIKTISINGYEAIYFLDNHDYNNLIYDNGDYIIELVSNIDKEAFIKIAKSVQKVEND